jgi:hypothetical protein
MSTIYRYRPRADITKVCTVGRQACNNVFDIVLWTRSMRQKSLNTVHADKPHTIGEPARSLNNRTLSITVLPLLLTSHHDHDHDHPYHHGLRLRLAYA